MSATARPPLPVWLRWPGLVLLVILLLAYRLSEGNAASLLEPEARGAMPDFARGFLPPAHGAEFLRFLARPLAETIAIAFLGMSLALVLAAPLAYLAATPDLVTTPGRRPGILRQASWMGARTVLNLMRSIPEIIWALVFVRALGLGAAAGILAIGIGYGGILGKVFAEIFESTPRAAARALAAAGAMALPTEMIDKALKGMEALYRRGIRYPISFAGAEADIAGQFPAAYNSGNKSDRFNRNPHRLLLGVTGSIGTGKSTVARMLEELGAPIIDFDVLSREVVEPGKPAYSDIVTFFGEQVLSEDKTLDREKLREIVFRDMEKRKKLESFTHPRIGEAYNEQVEKLSQEKDQIIIQVVIPLLIETHMQAMFDHLLMVYAPEEVQLKRIMVRDNISEELAMKIIRSQMSAEEKKGYCDLIVDNSGSLADTRKQVEEIWKKLQETQKKRLEKNKEF